MLEIYIGLILLGILTLAKVVDTIYYILSRDIEFGKMNKERLKLDLENMELGKRRIIIDCKDNIEAVLISNAIRKALEPKKSKKTK